MKTAPRRGSTISCKSSGGGDQDDGGKRTAVEMRVRLRE